MSKAVNYNRNIGQLLDQNPAPLICAATYGEYWLAQELNSYSFAKLQAYANEKVLYTN